MTNNRHSDIGDDEIRIISSGGKEPARRNRTARYLLIAIIAAILMIGVVAMTSMCAESEKDSDFDFSAENETTLPPPVTDTAIDSTFSVKGYTTLSDTVVNGIELNILTPRHAIPSLETGDSWIADSTVVLAAQAADIRGDNGRIVGAFVVKGDLMSKGESKAGFCSIINGEITVGVADATPMLEQALASEGYFFRQYPLVVGGQLVENKPRGRAIRKALAEIDGKICVVISRKRLTFHDFSQALIDAGARNAIYLVGANSAGCYTDADGNRYSFGPITDTMPENVNSIVWR